MTPWYDLGPALTPAAAAALHDRREQVAWMVLPAPGRNGVIARAHTFAADGGRYLPGHLTADSLDELRAQRPPGLHVEQLCPGPSPPGCLEWWWT